MSIDIIIKRIIIHHAGQDKGSCHQPGASPVTSGAARHPHPPGSSEITTTLTFMETASFFLSLVLLSNYAALTI